MLCPTEIFGPELAKEISLTIPNARGMVKPYKLQSGRGSFLAEKHSQKSRRITVLTGCAMGTKEKFEMPWQYNFPPFFTLQPNLDTRKLQLDAWCALVLNYHRAHRHHILDVNEAQSNALFNNAALNRKLPLEVITMILDELQRSGNLDWLDKQKRRCWILWRSVDDWAKVMYRWAVDNGMLNTVCTLYELAHGQDTSSEEFYGMDQELMVRVLRSLERQKKAEVISVEGNTGVKFF